MNQLNMATKVLVNGRIEEVPLPQPPEHRNPPLQALNVADKIATAERRTEVEEVVRAGIGAMKGAARGLRRMQKPLRAQR
jgi:hypothetical protein